MRNTLIISLLSFFIFLSCSQEKNPDLAAFEVYCEMVANDAKPFALHYPMEPVDVERLWGEFKGVAEKMGVELLREDSFPQTLLFPAEGITGKTVVLIYKGARLTQYELWKQDVEKANTEDPAVAEALSRRLGRLLGYSAQGINDLLMKHSGYRTLASFSVARQVTHLYYENPEAARSFYKDILGLAMQGETRFQVGMDSFIEIHPFEDTHGKDQPKSTAIALLTDQLPEWYAHIQSKDIPVKYTYKPREGGPHDGFVATDPGGYLLEFEEFKQHPENELFMAVLQTSPRIRTGIKNLHFYGSITWTYHRDLLRMQRFYEEVLGYRMVADQGWTKIYQTSSAGFIGLVDERRGMMDYTDQKAVEIEWDLVEEAAFLSYAGDYWGNHGFAHKTLKGPEQYLYRFGGIRK